MKDIDDIAPDDILSFWFPEGLAEAAEDDVLAFWNSRMQGGMDEAICRDWAETTRAAAAGRYDDWAATPEGRLALILALDQFPRSLWRDTPAAFGQDIKSCRLALEGIRNGHFDALPHLHQKQFIIICITHCEGPDHLERMNLCLRLNEGFRAIARPRDAERVERAVAQVKRVRGIIERFGRHPHRNPIYGRVSTPDEEAYIAEGDFPHIRRVEQMNDAHGN